MSKKPGSAGRILSRILKDNDLKSIDVVKASGVYKSSVSKILSNDMAITLETDILLTKALGLSQGYLLVLQHSMDLYNARNNKHFQTKVRNVKPIVRNFDINN